ncbi:MAG: hypothetical protein QOG67_3697 [Verrucomicrobiota bacterium]|jgi:hypothetical protein
MLALIRKLWKKGALVLALALATGLMSCASQDKHVALVNDQDNKYESQLPWNKQEKWENAGPMSNVSDRR